MLFSIMAALITFVPAMFPFLHILANTCLFDHSHSDRGRSQEDPMPEGQWPRQATPRPKLGVAAGRSYPASKVRGGS